MGHKSIMKPLNLLYAIGLFILSVFSSYAQDVIVKTDGSAVVCKVLTIDNSYVQFKKYSNLNGPTYTVSVADVSAITYENGERETFGKLYGTTYTQMYSHPEIFSSQQLDKIAKVGAIIIGAGGLTAATIVLVCERGYEDSYYDDSFYGGFYITASATVACTGLWYWGFKTAAKRARKRESYRSEYNLPSNSEKNLTAGIDILNDKTTSSSTLGLGFKYTF
jgi:hypothetical protein